MSEVVSLSEINAVEVDDQSTGFGSPETTDYSEVIELLDRELFPIVVQNAEVIVVCPWMGGAEVSLSVAMNNYPKLMVSEDPQVLISTVNQLIANQIIRHEEPPEDGEKKEDQAILLENNSASVEEDIVLEIDQDSMPEERENNQTQDTDQGINIKASNDKLPEALDATNDINQPSKGVEAIQIPQTQPAVEAVNKSESEGSRVIAAPAAPTIANSKDAQPTHEASGVEIVLSPPPFTETVAAEGSTPPEVVTTKSDVSKNVVLDPAGNMASLELAPARTADKEPLKEIEPEVEEVKRRSETREAVETNIEKDNIVETALVTPEERNDEEETEIAVHSTVEIVINSEFETEHVALEALLDPENLAAVGDLDLMESWNEAVEFAEAGQELAAVEYQAEVTSLPNFKEKILTHQVDLDIDEEGLNIQVAPELKVPLYLEGAAMNSELPIQTDLLDKEVGETLTQLADHIADSEPEAVEATNERLDNILRAFARSEATDPFIEIEAQEELEKLFTELLDEAGIDYTPEVIESLVHLTVNRQLLKGIKKLRKEVEKDDTPQDSGTNESILQILIGRLSSLQKAIMHAAAIGRSALRLSSSFAAS